MVFLANKEGLTGHAASVEMRANDNGPAARPKPKPDKVPAAAGEEVSANRARDQRCPDARRLELEPALTLRVEP